MTLLFFSVAAACPFQHLFGGPNPHAEPDRRRLSEDEPVLRSGPDAGTTTNMGCKCKSECGATIDFGQADCDWCETEDQCGHYSYSHLKYYDYCKYPTQPSYEDREASVKFNELWTQVQADSQHGSYPNVLNILGESIQTTFDDQWDVMPAGRLKYIHSVGIHCTVNFEITSSKYTGVFEKGSHDAFLRLGSAKPVDTTSGTVPGIGMKFLRSNVHSANWVHLKSLDGGKSYDMFGYTLSNHIDPPTGATQAVAAKFLQASSCVTMVGLSDAATWNQAGVQTANPVFPFMIQYKPSGKAHVSENGQTLDALLANMLKQTPAGVHLYDIYAQESPKSALELIGTVTTTNQCVTSKFGDEKLFFRHQRMEEDFTLRPEWASQVDPKTCWANSIPTTPPQKCSTFDRNLKHDIKRDFETLMFATGKTKEE